MSTGEAEEREIKSKQQKILLNFGAKLKRKINRQKFDVRGSSGRTTFVTRGRDSRCKRAFRDLKEKKRRKKE